MPKHELVDVEVLGVHLVGSPANRRPFALVKNLAGTSKEPAMPETAAAPFKKSDLLAKLEGLGDTISWPVIADMFGGQSAIAKALGIQVPTPTPTPAPAAPQPIDKSKLSPELVAYLDAIEKKANDNASALQLLVKANEDAERVDLKKRAELLKAAGFEVDGEKATALEIETLEKAQKQIVERLVKAGVLRAHGDPTQTRGETAGLATMVQKSVQHRLNGQAVSKDEERRQRLALYRENPGLLTAVVKEERRNRAA